MVFATRTSRTTGYRAYFPSTAVRASTDLLRHLPGATTTKVRYSDTIDGSMAALSAHPYAMLDPRHRAQTSFFERMQRDHAGQLRRGLAQLAEDIAAGNPPQAAGGATMIAWARPA